MTWRLGVFVIVSVAFAATGTSGAFASERGVFGRSPIPLSRVEAAFRLAPQHLNGMIVLPSGNPRHSGELGEYSFWAGKSYKEFEVRPRRMVPASLTVFATVAHARRVSIRLLKGGDCVAYPDQRVIPMWAKCTHLRVANVLLIMSSAISATPQRTLVGTLYRLGFPTRS
jgi:hypothetical protein